MGGDESVFLGDDFQTFDQHRCLLNTTFATVRRASEYMSSKRKFISHLEHAAHHLKLIYFFVSKTQENLKHSETTKNDTTETANANLQVTNIQFFRICSENCDRNSWEPQCTKQNFPKIFHFCCNYQKWLPAMH